MKTLKTMAAAAVAILATSSAALAQEIRMNPVTDHLEAKWNEAMDALQSSAGLDFLSRDGFYVVAGIAAALVLFVGIKVMRIAQHRDEMAKQERILRARRAAQEKIDREDARAAGESARRRRYGG